MIGKHAVLISGVSQGLGEALFEQVLALGHWPIGLGRRFTQFQLDAVRSAMAATIYCDLSVVPASIARELELATPKDVRKLVFISNAATIAPIAPVASSEYLGIGESIRVNIEGPIRITIALCALARDRSLPFQFVNISSGAAKRPIAGWSLYCLSKAAMEMFGRCLALEGLEREYLQIDPGVMDTEMQSKIRSAPLDGFPEREKFMRLKVDGKLKSAREVASTVLQKVFSQ